MATFQRFEDIQAWQKAKSLTIEIYRITCEDKFSKDYGLKEQIGRASVSIMANIAEGFGRKTNKDFAHFLVQAHGSAAEVQSHLHIALGLNYVSQETFSNLYNELDHISRMIMSLCRHLQQK